MRAFTFIPEGTDGCKVFVQLQPELAEYPDHVHPAIVICPGGAYAHVSEREGEPAAKKFFAAGYHTFILHYSILERAKNFEPLCQLAATVAQIRRNAQEWKVDPQKVVVCGFSAGAHLAASLGTLFNDKAFLRAFKQIENVRPDAMLLGYPVITADDYTHPYTLELVSGGAPKGSNAYDYWGLNHHVDSQTPPTFLWHTATDELVPVENSLKMALALSAAHVPYELHVLPTGEHGMSVCTSEVGCPHPYNARWIEWSIEWLSRILCYEE